LHWLVHNTIAASLLSLTTMYGTGTVAASTVVAPRPAYATASYTAPMTTTAYAAPATYAAPIPQVTTNVPSYVAPPVAYATQPVAVAAAPPVAVAAAVPTLAPPASLTAGIPTPEQIAQQKAQFAAALDKQLQDAIATVQKETQIEKDMVKFNAEKQIALYNMQVDEKLTEMCATAAEQATISDLELKKAKIERGLQLDSQAQGLLFDYNMKATQQELQMKQAQFTQQFMNEENKLAAQYAGQMQKAGGVGLSGMPAAAPTSVVAAPAAYPTTVAAPASYSYPTTTVAAPMTTTMAAPTMAYPGAVTAGTVI